MPEPNLTQQTREREIRKSIAAGQKHIKAGRIITHAEQMQDIGAEIGATDLKP